MTEPRANAPKFTVKHTPVRLTQNGVGTWLIESTYGYHTVCESEMRVLATLLLLALESANIEIEEGCDDGFGV